MVTTTNSVGGTGNTRPECFGRYDPYSGKCRGCVGNHDCFVETRLKAERKGVQDGEANQSNPS